MARRALPYLLGLVAAISVGACAGADEDEGASSDSSELGGVAVSPLPLTKRYQSWARYYPMNRSQGRGNRWSNPWVLGSERQPFVGQYTWQYPDANDGTGSNRPNPSLPASYGMRGLYAAHPVEYFDNVNCNDVAFCNDPGHYEEVISESGGATFLELWGAGGRDGMVVYLDDQALPGGCTLANAQKMMAEIAQSRGAQYRKPLAFPLPATPKTASVGGITCEVLVTGYTQAVRARLAFVVTENRAEVADTATDASGKPWTILHARNIYYLEKDGSGGCSPLGADVVQRVTVGGKARSVTFCPQNYEVYAMRSIPAEHRGQNGFGSWNNSVDPACTTVDDCPAHGGGAASFARHWESGGLGAARYERCSMGARGMECAPIAPPPGT